MKKQNSTIPEKCVACIHHKQTDGSGDVIILCDDTGNTPSWIDYCDYTEYFNSLGCPVPYPNFFKEEYPCKGWSEK